MTERILITGGAGFIGRHLARSLVDAGCTVRILDSLLPQVHGADPRLPSWLRRDCEFLQQDVRDTDAVAKALRDVTSVVHLAADTGTGQSMYEMRRYADVNVVGTAVLFDAVVATGSRLRKVVLASSRAVYGEGKYLCAACGPVFPAGRSDEQLRAGRWDPSCPRCSGPIEAVATDEESPQRPVSVYGTTKLAQENLLSNFGGAFKIPAVALRYQNVYGAGQSLTNPYTGILTHFFTRIRNGLAPRVFEDGRESRDFVHVSDVVAATRTTLELESLAGVFNVGSGIRTTILELATAMTKAAGVSLEPEIVGEYRVGDIRHCFADLRRSAAQLSFTPRTSLADGIAEFTEWAAGQETPAPAQNDDRLAALGLLKSGVVR